MPWNGYLMGRFEAEQNGIIYEHDPLDDEILVCAIFEANPEQILQDADKMIRGSYIW